MYRALLERFGESKREVEAQYTSSIHESSTVGNFTCVKRGTWHMDSFIVKLTRLPDWIYDYFAIRILW